MPEKAGQYGHVQPLRDAYRQCMDYAFQQVFTGATDYNTAIRQATRNLADMGVRVIDYESGVHTSLEAAVRRNIMGGLGLMQEQISQQNHDEMGANGWEISAHAASAPDHEPIQGRQYSDEAFKRLNGSLKRRIGTLNCGHKEFPIILGVSEPQYTPAELEAMRQQNAKGVTIEGRHYSLYEATQMQRKMERSIRKQKKRILVDKATGDEEKLQIDQTKLRMQNTNYKKFSDAAGLRTQRERTFVAGVGRKEAEEASRAPKLPSRSAGRPSLDENRQVPSDFPETSASKTFTNGGGSGIIQLNRNLERKETNSGAFSALEIPLQKRRIIEISKKFGIDLKDITFKIQRKESLMSLPICGSADYDRVGCIYLFPNAFANEEQLVKTILHETCHVKQLRKYGKEYTQQYLDQMEKQAYRYESIWYTILKDVKL